MFAQAMNPCPIDAGAEGCPDNVIAASSDAPLSVILGQWYPIREELFSVERLEEHARSLAAAQPVINAETDPRPAFDGRLAETGRSACGRIAPSPRRFRKNARSPPPPNG